MNEEILFRRKTYLIGDSNKISQMTLDFLDNEVARAEKEIEELRKADYRKVKKNVEEMKRFYENILILSRGYKTQKTKYFEKEDILNIIIESLEEGEKYFYNKKVKEHTNWWQWEIGIPLRINDIFVLIKDKVSIKMMQKILETTRYFQPDARYSGNNPVAIHPSNYPFRLSTGGNRTDTVKISFLRGALLNDTEEMTNALKALPEVWKYKDDDIYDRDGFYQDGSFIQHGSIAYTGGYGGVLLEGIGEILFLIGGTKYSEYLVGIESFYEIIFNSFEPFFFKGAFPDMLNGRGVVRKELYDHVIGHKILNSLLLIALNAPDNYRERLGEIIKREILKDDFYKYFENERSVFFQNKMKNFLDKINLKQIKYVDNIKICNNMTRIMKRTEDYALGIGMHSNKVGNYETMNGENLRGWFTGDGTYYLYDNDLDEYKDYWNEIDYYYIPGATEIKMNMDNIDAQRNSETEFSKIKMAGGTSYNSYGVAGMEFINWNEKLSSRKSWFFLKWGILFAETNIKGIGEIYTTIINRKFKNIPLIEIDGREFKKENTQKIIEAEEIKINDKRYIFLEKTKVNIEIEKKENSYFLKVWTEYGMDPRDKHLIWGLITDKEISAKEVKRSFEFRFSEKEHILEDEEYIYTIDWNTLVNKNSFCSIYKKIGENREKKSFYKIS